MTDGAASERSALSSQSVWMADGSAPGRTALCSRKRPRSQRGTAATLSGLVAVTCTLMAIERECEQNPVPQHEDVGRSIRLATWLGDEVSISIDSPQGRSTANANRTNAATRVYTGDSFVYTATFASGDECAEKQRPHVLLADFVTVRASTASANRSQCGDTRVCTGGSFVYFATIACGDECTEPQ